MSTEGVLTTVVNDTSPDHHQQQLTVSFGEQQQRQQQQQVKMSPEGDDDKAAPGNGKQPQLVINSDGGGGGRSHEDIKTSKEQRLEGETNQLNSIVVDGNKFGSDTIVAKLSNLRISDSANGQVPKADDTGLLLSVNGIGSQLKSHVQEEDFSSTSSIQHNNSVCVDGDGEDNNNELLAIVTEASHSNHRNTNNNIDSVINRKKSSYRESRKSEGDGMRGAGGGGLDEDEVEVEVVMTDKELLPVKRTHTSKSMCDNDSIVDHLINKKDSMRIRFDDNGDALIQKRNILHRKFYKSVDDELHKKASRSLSLHNNKNQCMTLDRVFKKLRESVRKSKRTQLRRGFCIVIMSMGL